MARLCVYKANGGKVSDLIRYKKEREETILREEIKRAYDQEIKKKQNKYADR